LGSWHWWRARPPAEGFLIGVQGEIVFWVGSSFAIYLIGRYLLGSAATYGQVLRPVGFAAVPGLLILIAALASLVGAQVVVFAVLVPWRLATSFVAVERALEVGRPKSAVALLLGVVCGLVLVELGTVTLLNVLA
jgi:phage-related protein